MHSLPPSFTGSLSLTENSPWLSSIARPLPFSSELGHDWMMQSSTALQVEDNSSSAVHLKTKTKPILLHFLLSLFKNSSVVDSQGRFLPIQLPRNRWIFYSFFFLNLNRHLTHVVKETGSRTKQESKNKQFCSTYIRILYFFLWW